MRRKEIVALRGEEREVKVSYNIEVGQDLVEIMYVPVEGEGNARHAFQSKVLAADEGEGIMRAGVRYQREDVGEDCAREVVDSSRRVQYCYTGVVVEEKESKRTLLICTLYIEIENGKIQYPQMMFKES